MPDIFTLYEQFIADHTSGRDPDAVTYVTRAGDLGDELAILIADYLAQAPVVRSEGARRRAAAVVQAAWEPRAASPTLADRLKAGLARGSANLMELVAQIQALPGSATLVVPVMRAGRARPGDVISLVAPSGEDAEGWLLSEPTGTSVVVRGLSPAAEGMQPWLYVPNALVKGEDVVRHRSARFRVADEPAADTQLVVFTTPPSEP